MKPIESKLESIESKLKSIESKLKSIESKLKPIESKLKSIESKLISIEILTEVEYPKICWGGAQKKMGVIEYTKLVWGGGPTLIRALHYIYKYIYNATNQWALRAGNFTPSCPTRLRAEKGVGKDCQAHESANIVCVYIIVV